MIKAVIFDLDGTLTDTLDDLADAVNYVLSRNHYAQRTRDEVRSFVGNGLYMLMRRALPADVSDDVAAACTDILTAYYKEHSLVKTKPYDGIFALLEKLNRDGILCAVATNKREAAAKEICLRFFGSLLCNVKGDNGQRPLKPNRAVIDELLREMNVSAAETLYVGDSEADAFTAHNADLTAIGVTWGFRNKKQLEDAGISLFAEKSEDIYNIVKNYG
ncbi:MAG: HAD hydrolase-like protein [Clostridia bacterium]|nr:HAD hydrolase-like protein [Clostridia bacterium]